MGEHTHFQGRVSQGSSKFAQIQQSALWTVAFYPGCLRNMIVSWWVRWLIRGFVIWRGGLSGRWFDSEFICQVIDRSIGLSIVCLQWKQVRQWFRDSFHSFIVIIVLIMLVATKHYVLFSLLQNSYFHHSILRKRYSIIHSRTYLTRNVTLYCSQEFKGHIPHRNTISM
jgi:hypothetical protein